MENSGTRTEDVTEGSEYGKATPLADWSGVLAQQGYVFGVDMSGDGERVVLCDLHGAVLGRASYNRPLDEGRAPDETMGRVLGMMLDLLGRHEVKAREVLRVGVGFGGPVDAKRGIVRQAPGFPHWEGFPVAGNIEARFDVPTFLDNDARLAALGEVWFGAGEGNPECDLVYVHWSTGVGGGIVSGGRLLRGATTTAGEVGHTIVRMGGREALPCRCGGRGHLEAYVREEALLERARALGSPAESVPDVASLFAQAESDPSIRSLVEEAVELMAVTVGNLITFINPSLVVVGGRVAREGAHLIPRIEELARAYAMPVSAQEVKIVPAHLGEDSAVMGAVALALDSLR